MAFYLFIAFMIIPLCGQINSTSCTMYTAFSTGVRHRFRNVFFFTKSPIAFFLLFFLDIFASEKNMKIKSFIHNKFSEKVDTKYQNVPNQCTRYAILLNTVVTRN